MATLILLTIIRLTVPLIILRIPLLGALLASGIDAYDWNLISFQKPSDYLFYQNWDKALDLYYQILLVIMTRRWQEQRAKRVTLFLFIYRVIGDILFFTFHSRMALFFFPNFFENLVLFYLLHHFFWPHKSLPDSWSNLTVISLLLFVPKVIHEFFIHFLQRQPWEIYNTAAALGLTGMTQQYTNYAIWGTLLYFIPLALLLFYFRQLYITSHSSTKP